MSEAPTPDSIAQSFVTFYYTTFDGGKGRVKELEGLYKDYSMLTWEQNKYLGGENIIKGIEGMSFQKLTHLVSTTDVQPSGIPGALLVTVVGDLQIDDEERTLKFFEVFHLLPEESSGSYFVHNQIFRLAITTVAN